MQFQPNINVVEESNSFIVYDCTGILTRDNPGGWGGINPLKKQVTESYFLITPPNLPAGSDPFKIDVLQGFPNNNDLGYEILPYMVGMPNNQILSGQWKVKWVVKGLDHKGNAWEKSATCVKIFKKQVECCVDKWTKILNKDAFKDPKQQKIIELNNLLQSMEYAIDNELNNEAIATIEFLQDQCVCPDC